jgi:hypothetical protein
MLALLRLESRCFGAGQSIEAKRIVEKPTAGVKLACSGIDGMLMIHLFTIGGVSLFGSDCFWFCINIWSDVLPSDNPNVAIQIKPG